MFKQMPRSIEEIVSQMSTQNQYSHTDSAEFIFAAKIECCPLNKNEVHFAELWKHVIPMEKCYSKFIFYFVASNFRKCLEPRAVIQSNHPHAAVLSVADSYSQKTNRTSSSCAVWETILKFTLRFNINFISVFCMENNMAICLMKRTGTKKNRSTITKTTLSKETPRPKQWKINLPSTPKVFQRNATPEIQFPDQIKPNVITVTWINKKQETNKIHVL